MKSITLLLTALLLIGCQSTLEAEFFYEMEELCSRNGGIHRVQSWATKPAEFDNYTRVYCHDGAMYEGTRQQLNEIMTKRDTAEQEP